MDRHNVLVACTGSVASIKIPTLVQELISTNQIDVRLVCTKNSLQFFNPNDLNVKVHTDDEEWGMWKKKGDPILHIDLRKWADILVIAPLDANTLAKMANGICDNLLTCVVRAWDMKQPLIFAPAMNTYMWEHPLTAKHIATLRDLGYREIPCVEKTLACGDKGYGAMAEVSSIVREVLGALPPKQQQPTS